MIVPMKKVTVVIPDTQVDQALGDLGNLGIIHVTPVTEPRKDEPKSLIDQLGKLQSAARILERECPSANTYNTAEDIVAVAEIIKKLHEFRHQELERFTALQRELERLNPIGDFDLETIKDLEHRGIFIRLYTCSTGQIKSIPNDMAHVVIGHQQDTAYIAAVSKDDEPPLSAFQPFTFPEQSISAIKETIAKVEERLADINGELSQLAPHERQLRVKISELGQQCKLRRIQMGMGALDPLAYLQGYCPTTRFDRLRRAAVEGHWGLLIEDPGEMESPPTLIENRNWIRIISPVFRMLNTLPGYREYDVSLCYLVFFTVFFAFLVGDAGYGILFLTGTFIVDRKMKLDQREPFMLAYVLSIATILWGAVTGNWFGIQSLSEASGIRHLVVPGLNAFSSDSQSLVMLVCFVIGAAHISIAHVIAGFRQRASLRALSHLGWILIISGAFFIVRLLVLEVPMPSFTYGLLVGGAALAVAFAEPQRNIMKAIGIGLARLPMRTMNCFSDIISYIRLFAVGMATLAVAASFNDMAATIGFRTPLLIILSTFILILGHGINIIMALLAVVVHGVRLNMLEFSGHLDMQWSGDEYQPFRIDK